MRPAQITAAVALLAATAAAQGLQPERPYKSVTVQGLEVTVIPIQPVFHPDNGPVFDVHFRNTTDKTLQLWDVGHYYGWKMTMGSYRVISTIKFKRMPIGHAIRPGKTLTVRADLSEHVQFLNMDPRVRAVARSSAPPGRYGFQAEINVGKPPNPGDKTWWTGTIKTKPSPVAISRNAIRPAATAPGNLPIRAELVAAERTIKMPPERLGLGYRRRLQERMRSGKVTPASEIPLSLKLTNTSDRPVSVAVDGHMQHLDLALEGPGVLLLPSNRAVAQAAARSRREQIPPGATLEIEIDGLYHGRLASWATAWTETGVYRLQATWRTSVTGIEGVKPGATVTVITEPITLRITDLEGKITPPVRPEDVRRRFEKLLAQLRDDDFRTREGATRQLIAAARADPLIEEKLRQTLGQGGLDAETLARIRHVLEAIESEPS